MNNDQAKPVVALTPADIERTAVWQFVNDDSELDETFVRPVQQLPVQSLAGRVAGIQVTLQNGWLLSALLGNVDLNAPRLTSHFLTMSVYVEEGWFHLARYHDFDVEERGPAALSKRLGLQISDVFPIRYDLSHLAMGDPEVLRGSVRAEPAERLSRAELISLAL